MRSVTWHIELAETYTLLTTGEDSFLDGLLKMRLADQVAEAAISDSNITKRKALGGRRAEITYTWVRRYADYAATGLALLQTASEWPGQELQGDVTIQPKTPEGTNEGDPYTLTNATAELSEIYEDGMFLYAAVRITGNLLNPA
jgi:hypothetical protein